MDSIVAGLRLRVAASGVKTYIVRKRIGSKVHNVTLGRHLLGFGLAAARRRARDLLTDIEQGQSISKRTGANRGYFRASYLLIDMIRGIPNFAARCFSQARKKQVFLALP